MIKIPRPARIFIQILLLTFAISFDSFGDARMQKACIDSITAILNNSVYSERIDETVYELIAEKLHKVPDLIKGIMSLLRRNDVPLSLKRLIIGGIEDPSLEISSAICRHTTCNTIWENIFVPETDKFSLFLRQGQELKILATPWSQHSGHAHALILIENSSDESAVISFVHQLAHLRFHKVLQESADHLHAKNFYPEFITKIHNKSAISSTFYEFLSEKYAKKMQQVLSNVLLRKENLKESYSGQQILSGTTLPSPLGDRLAMIWLDQFEIRQILEGASDCLKYNEKITRFLKRHADITDEKTLVALFKKHVRRTKRPSLSPNQPAPSKL